MRTLSKKKKVILVILITLLAVQAIRPAKNNGSPWSDADITKVVNVPESTMVVLKKACFDCHSDYTVYPWYNNITPVNWWLADYVENGKQQLNFTTFGNLSLKKKRKFFLKLKRPLQTVKCRLNLTPGFIRKLD